MEINNIYGSILVGVITVLCNFLVYKYQFKKRNKWTVLNQQLKELLLPLYYILEEDGFNQIEMKRKGDWDYGEDTITEPRRIKEKIINIIQEKVYLADDELHDSCLEFLTRACSYDEDDEFQKAYNYLGFSSHEKLDELKKIIHKKYNIARNQYLKIN